MRTITDNYDAAGNLLTSTDALGKLTSRAYDALNRLVQVNYADGQSAVYAYNATDANVAAGSYSYTAKAYDNSNAVTTSAAVNVVVNAALTVTLTAPANNTLLTPPATVNLLATAADSGGTVSKVEFYRGTTLIATVTTPSSGTTSSGTWTYSDTNVAVGTYSYTAKAYDNTNAVTTSVAALVTVSAASAGSGNVFYIHSDHLNTPRLITNQAQQAVWRWDQAEPFGAYPANANPSGLGVFEFNLRFPGQYFDAETGLHYNYYRDYDPSIGRYVESDPIGLNGGINTFAYVGGYPLSNTDPTGEAPWILIGAVAGGLFDAINKARDPCASWGQIGLAFVGGAISGGISAAAPIAAIGRGLGIAGAVGFGTAFGAAGSAIGQAVGNGGVVDPAAVAINAAPGGIGGGLGNIVGLSSALSSLRSGVTPTAASATAVGRSVGTGASYYYGLAVGAAGATSSTSSNMCTCTQR